MTGGFEVERKLGEAQRERRHQFLRIRHAYIWASAPACYRTLRSVARCGEHHGMNKTSCKNGRSFTVEEAMRGALPLCLRSLAVQTAPFILWSVDIAVELGILFDN